MLKLDGSVAKPAAAFTNIEGEAKRRQLNGVTMETLSFELQDGVGVLTFQRPQALNAINSKMVSEMIDWLTEIESNKKVRAVILTGAGEKAFIAGADIKEMSEYSPKEAEVFSEKGHQVLLGLQQLKVPVIGAVNGFALGGGCEMAMACDFILASENASFGLPEVTLGLIPGFGGTQRLPKFVGHARAAEMIFSGRRYSATDALAFGLVNSVYPQADLIAAAKKMAHDISTRGPVAISAAKKLLNETSHMSLRDGLRVEKESFAKLFATRDQKEGAKAFIEKRPAQFLGE